MCAYTTLSADSMAKPGERELQAGRKGLVLQVVQVVPGRAAQGLSRGAILTSVARPADCQELS